LIPDVSVTVKQLGAVVPGKSVNIASVLLSSQDPNVQLGVLTLMIDMPVEDFKLPLSRLIDANYDPLLIVGLQVANRRLEQLDLNSVLKIAKSANADVRKLALENLRYSG